MLLLIMLFMHIVDDYYLQGVLSKLKRKDNWKLSEKQCRFDYIPALLCHAFSWTFMIMLPILIMFNFKINFVFYLVFISNFIIHAIVDDMKTNKKKINLVIDQSIHVLQVIITWIIFII